MGFEDWPDHKKACVGLVLIPNDRLGCPDNSIKDEPPWHNGYQRALLIFLRGVGGKFPTYSLVFISMRPSKSRSTDCLTSDFPIYPIRHGDSCLVKAAFINPLPYLQSQDLPRENLLTLSLKAQFRELF